MEITWAHTGKSLALPNFGSTASAAQTGKSFACTYQSSSLGRYGAYDHITGNKVLLSFISRARYLPTLTLASGNQTQAQEIDTAKLLPSLSVDNVLYVPDIEEKSQNKFLWVKKLLIKNLSSIILYVSNVSS